MWFVGRRIADVLQVNTDAIHGSILNQSRLIIKILPLFPVFRIFLESRVDAADSCQTGVLVF